MSGRRCIRGYRASTSEWLLSSKLLTVIVAALTLAELLILLIDSRSLIIQIIVTAITVSKVAFFLWMFITALITIYDNIRRNDVIFDFFVSLDMFLMFSIVWTNTGLLFWLWDSAPDRDTFFTELSDNNPFLAWVTFYTIAKLVIMGVGFGLYLPKTLSAQVWSAILVDFSFVLLGTLIGSLLSLVLGNRPKPRKGGQTEELTPLPIIRSGVQ